MTTNMNVTESIKLHRIEELQQWSFQKMKNKSWTRYDDSSMNKLEICLEKFFVKKIDVKSYITNLKRKTMTYNENRTIYTSLVVIQHYPDAERIEDIASGSFRSDQYQIEMLVKVRKCHSKAIDDVADGCCIYLDKYGRIYNSWDDFKINNKYKKGVLVAPEGGIYCGSKDNEKKVKLEYIPSPELTTLFKWRTVSNYWMDFIVSIIGSMIIIQHFLNNEVNTHFILAGSTSTIACALYGWIVSSVHLRDIKIHQIKKSEIKDFNCKRFQLHRAAIILLAVARCAMFIVDMIIDSGYIIGHDYKAIHDGVVIISLMSSGLAILFNLALFLSSIFERLFKHSDDKKNDETISFSLELFMLLSSIWFFFNVYSKEFGFMFQSSGHEEIPNTERPRGGRAGGRGGERRERPPKDNPRTAEQPKAANPNPTNGEKIFTFDYTHGLFSLMLVIFTPSFIPWLSIIDHF